MNEMTLPADVTSINKYDPKIVEEMARSSSFLPRLQVNGSNTETVKSGDAAMGIFALVYDKKKWTELGKQIDTGFWAFRPKALRIGGDAGPVSYFNRENPEFGKIMRDSEIKDSGCMFGLEFLIWVPGESKFATFFCGSKSGRREAPSILDVMNSSSEGEDPKYVPAAVSLTTHFVPSAPGRKFSWWSFQATKCSTPLTSQPNSDDLKLELMKFLNPPDSEVEKAEPVAGAAGRER